MKSLFRIYVVLSTLLVLGASHPYNFYQQPPPPGYYHQQWRHQPDAQAQYLPPDHDWQIRGYHQPPAHTYLRPEVINYQPVEHYPTYPDIYSSASHTNYPHEEKKHIIKKVIVPVAEGPQVINLSPDGDAQKVKITQVRPKSDGTYDASGLPEVVKQALAKFLATEKNSNNHTHAFTIIAHDDVVVQKPDSKAKNTAPAKPVYNHPVFKHNNGGQKPYRKTSKTHTSQAQPPSRTISKSVSAEALAVPTTQAKAFASHQDRIYETSQEHQTKHNIVHPTYVPAHIPIPVYNYKPIPTYAHMPGDVRTRELYPIDSDSYYSEEKPSAQEAKHTPTTTILVSDHKPNGVKPTSISELEHKTTLKNRYINNALVNPKPENTVPEKDASYSSDNSSPTKKEKHTKTAKTPTPVTDYHSTTTPTKPTLSTVVGNKPTQDKHAPNEVPVTPISEKHLPKTDGSDSSHEASPAEKVNHMKEPAQKPSSVPNYNNTPTTSKPTQRPVDGNKPTLDKHTLNDVPVTLKSDKHTQTIDGSDCSDETSPTEKINHTKQPAPKPTPVPDYDNTPAPTKSSQSPVLTNKPTSDEHALNDAPVTPVSEKDLPKTDDSYSSDETSPTEKVYHTKEPAQKPMPVLDYDSTTTTTKPTQRPVVGNKPTPDKNALNEAPVTPESEKHLPNPDGSDCSDESSSTEKENHPKVAQTPTPVSDYDTTITPTKPTQSPVEENKLTPDKHALNDLLVTPESEKHFPKINCSDSSDETSPTEKVSHTKKPAQKPTSVPEYGTTPTPTKPTQRPAVGNKPTPNKHALNDVPVTSESEKHLPQTDDSDCSDETAPTEKVNHAKEHTPKSTKVPDYNNTPVPTKPTQSPVKHLTQTDDSDCSDETSPSEKVNHAKEHTPKPTPVPDYNKSPAPTKPTQSPVKHLPQTDDSDCSDEASPTEKVNHTKEPAQKPSSVPNYNNTPTTSKLTQRPVDGNRPTLDKHTLNDVPVTLKSDKQTQTIDGSDCSDETSPTEKINHTKQPAPKPTAVPDYDNTPAPTKSSQSPVLTNKPTSDEHVLNDAPVTPVSEKDLPKTDDSDSSDETSPTEKVYPTKEPAQKPMPVPDYDSTTTTTKPTQRPVVGNKPTPDKNALNEAPVTPESEKHLPNPDGSDCSDESSTTEKENHPKVAQTPTPVSDYDTTITPTKPTQSPVEENKLTPDKHALNDLLVTPESEKHFPKINCSDSSDETSPTEKVSHTKKPAQKPTSVPEYGTTPTPTKPTQRPAVGNKPTPNKHALNDVPVTSESEKHLPQTDDSDCSDETSPTEKVNHANSHTPKPTPVPDYINTPAPTIPTQSPVKHLPQTDDSDCSDETSPTEKVNHAKEHTPKSTKVPDYNNTPASTKPTQSPVKHLTQTNDSDCSDETSPSEKVNHSKEHTPKPTPVPKYDYTVTPTKQTQSPVEGNRPTPDKYALNDVPVTSKSEKHLPQTDDSDCSDETSPTEKVNHAKEHTPKPTPVPDYNNTAAPTIPTQSPVKHLPQTDDSDCSDEASPTEKVNHTKEPAQTPSSVPNYNNKPTTSKLTQRPVDGNRPTLDKHTLNDVPVTLKSDKHTQTIDGSDCSDETSPTEKINHTKQPAPKPTPVPDYDNTSAPTESSQSPVLTNKPISDEHVLNDAPVTPVSEKDLPKTDDSDSSDETSPTEKVYHTKEPAQKPMPVPDYDSTTTTTKPTQRPVVGNKPTPDKNALNEAPVTAESEKHLPNPDGSDCSDESSTTEKENHSKVAQTLTPVSDYDTTITPTKPTLIPVEENKPTPDKHALNDLLVTPESEKHFPKINSSDSSDETSPTEKVSNTKKPAQKPTSVPEYETTPTPTKPTQRPAVGNKPTPNKHALNDVPVTSESEKHLPQTDDSDCSDETSPTEKVNHANSHTPKSTKVPDYNNTPASTKPTQSPVKHLTQTDDSDCSDETSPTEKVNHTKEHTPKPTPVPDYNNTPALTKPTLSPVKHLPQTDDSDFSDETSPTEKVNHAKEHTPKSTKVPDYNNTPASTKPTQSPVKHLTQTDDSDCSDETSPTEKVNHTKEHTPKPTPIPDYNNTPAPTKPTQSPVKHLTQTDDSDCSDETSPNEKVNHAKERTPKPTQVPNYDNTVIPTKPTQSPVVGNRPTPDKYALNDVPVTSKSEKHLPQTDDSDCSDETSPTEKVNHAKEHTPKSTKVPDYNNTPAPFKPTQSPVKHSTQTDDSDSSDELSPTEKVNHAKEHTPKPMPVSNYDYTVTPTKPPQSLVEGNKPTPNKHAKTDVSDSSEESSPTEKVNHMKEPARKPTTVLDYDNTPYQENNENKSTPSNNTVNNARVPPKSDKAIPTTDDPAIPLASEIKPKPDPSSDSDGKTDVVKPEDECDDQLIIVSSEEPSDQGKQGSGKDTKSHHSHLQDENSTNEKTMSTKKFAQESDTVRTDKDISEKRSISYHEKATDNSKQEETKEQFDRNDTKTKYIENDKKQQANLSKDRTLQSHSDKSAENCESNDLKETIDNDTKNSKTESVNAISYIIAVIKQALSRDNAIQQLFKEPCVKETVQHTFYNNE